jgi:predicted metal-binding membrane protein
MVVLFGLGVMSIAWMAVVAALIFAQKILPYGDRLTRVFAVAFVAAGVWIAAAPGSVPGLTQPDSPAADQARMRMMHKQPPGMEKQGPADLKPSGGSGSMKP